MLALGGAEGSPIDAELLHLRRQHSALAQPSIPRAWSATGK